ncbi:MAG: hypothetical protein KAG96_02025 [Ichthyobacteriaceae bacterium]|nr:hypothetical protein [Ichthyobacteriaceae bacterium]
MIKQITLLLVTYIYTNIKVLLLDIFKKYSSIKSNYKAYSIFKIYIALVLILFSTNIYANKIPQPSNGFVIENADFNKENFNSYTNVYKSDVDYGILEVANKIASGSIYKVDNKSTRGFNKDYYWVVFNIKNNVNEDVDYVISSETPNIHKVTLYNYKPDGSFNKLFVAGTDLKLKERTIISGQIFFPITATSNSNETYILKIKKINDSLSFPLKIQTNNYYNSSMDVKKIIHLIFFIVVMLAILMGMILTFTYNNKEVLMYTLYIASTWLMFLSYRGYTTEYVYPNIPEIFNYTHVLYFISTFSFIRFSLHFFKIKDFFSKLYFLLDKMSYIYIIALVVWIYTIDEQKIYVIKFYYYLTVFNLLIIILVALLVKNKKKSLSNIFFLALSPTILGALVIMFIGLGYLPGSLLKYDLMMTGTFIEIIIFNVTLFDKEIKNEFFRQKLLIEKNNHQRLMFNSYISGLNKTNNSITQKLQVNVLNSIDEVEHKLLIGTPINDISITDSLSVIYNNVRTISHQLSHQTLKFSGLKSSLKLMIDELNSTTDIDISIDFLDFKKVERSKRLHIYRIIQEAVNNSITHSKATEILIEVIGHQNEFTFNIEDDGIGFNVNKKNYKSGLLEIETLVKILDGEMEISSSSKMGTSIFCAIPIVEG